VPRGQYEQVVVLNLGPNVGTTFINPTEGEGVTLRVARVAVGRVRVGHILAQINRYLIIFQNLRCGQLRRPNRNIICLGDGE